MKTEPQTVLSDQVAVLLGLERAIEHAVGGQSELAAAHPELHSSLAAIQACCRVQGNDLEGYLRQNGLDLSGMPSAVVHLLEEGTASGILARALCADVAAFSLAAGGYAVLAELSLRLYEPVLREVAPRHLTSHARAVRRLNDLLPSVVVKELDQLELDCRCVCPMCSLGACGCTEAGRGWISEAWQAGQPEVDERPGLAVTAPRHGSQLAEHGVRGGDRLIAIDGKPLTTSGMSAVIDIQAAIRKHPIGDELLLAIARGGEQDRELRVRHVNDYPSE
jgi:hypothetical protein